MNYEASRTADPAGRARAYPDSLELHGPQTLAPRRKFRGSLNVRAEGELIMSCRRGTTNTNQRGSAADRRRRKQYLLDTFGDGRTALCVFCGTELSFETISVDRIKPGVNGGRYTRDNIRPACSPCQSRQGGAIAKVKAALGRLDGSEMAALSLITGLDTDELNDLGGL